MTQRVLATIVNIGYDICQQGICTPEDLEGGQLLPLATLLDPWASATKVAARTFWKSSSTSKRSTVTPLPTESWLRRRGALGLSLTHTEA